jgi:inosine/xanthosine triphosphate pyrophosphatase family protein
MKTKNKIDEIAKFADAGLDISDNFTNQGLMQQKLDLTIIQLGSSSNGKRLEYQSFGLSIPIITIEDIQEVQGTDLEVITYKAISVGENILIEDTSLDIEGFSVGVNIKWLTKEIHENPIYNGKKAYWRVFLAVIQKGKLYITKSEVIGTIDQSKKSITGAFGFDDVFIPTGSTLTLMELGNNKINYSARKLALDNLLSGIVLIKDIKEIPNWTGSYQS